jgi:hypothetical protein
MDWNVFARGAKNQQHISDPLANHRGVLAKLLMQQSNGLCALHFDYGSFHIVTRE